MAFILTHCVLPPSGCFSCDLFESAHTDTLSGIVQDSRGSTRHATNRADGGAVAHSSRCTPTFEVGGARGRPHEGRAHAQVDNAKATGQWRQQPRAFTNPGLFSPFFSVDATLRKTSGPLSSYPRSCLPPSSSRHLHIRACRSVRHAGRSRSAHRRRQTKSPKVLTRSVNALSHLHRLATLCTWISTRNIVRVITART